MSAMTSYTPILLPHRTGLSSDNIFVIAGPCVIESEDQCRRLAEQLKGSAERYRVPMVFKSSFDKANRSSGASFRGLGIDEGLKVLEKIGQQFELPTTTDIHEPDQAHAAAQVVDILQIPAFLARQTDLLQAAARTGKCVNIKKGQFMAPAEMATAVNKVQEVGPCSVLLTERGTFFGYHRLVNDMRGIAQMQELQCPVVFDATHSTQLPGGGKDHSQGESKYAALLARAAVGAGCDGLFVEVHPDPPSAKSDAACQIEPRQFDILLRQCTAIRKALAV